MAELQTLRPYQQAQLDAIWRSFEGGQNRVLVKSPTGTGKTTTFAALPKHLEAWLRTFPEGERKMLVIAHREELLDQAAERIQGANPGKVVMVEQGDRHSSPYADVVVASIQTLSARKFHRLRKLIARTTFRVVVVDECHHAAATTYRTALVHLGFLPPAQANDEDSEHTEAATYEDVKLMEQTLTGWDAVAPRDRLLVGVTATPNRSDSIGLGCVFQTIAYSYDLKTAIADRWLVPITPWCIDTKTSLDEVRTQHGDFNQRDLSSAVNNHERNLQALKAWEQHAKGRPTLAFTVDVQHAKDVAEMYAKAGYRAAYVSGETPKDDRRAILANYQEGGLDFLANCMILTEGTDLPRTSCILHLKPTKSATLYEQMTGRGLRLFPNKTDCVVIDLVDLTKRHSLQSAPVLYGLPPGVTVSKGKSLAEAEEMFNNIAAVGGIDIDKLLKERGHLSLEQLGAFAKQQDIWFIPDLGDFGEGRIVQWLKLAEDRYQVAYPWADGHEYLEVVKDLIEHWDVQVTIKPLKKGEPVRQRTIATRFPTATQAADAAEHFITRERHSVLRLKGKNAPWMQAPASPAQIDLLKRMKAKIPPNITKGRASELIEIGKARKGTFYW